MVLVRRANGINRVAEQYDNSHRLIEHYSCTGWKSLYEGGVFIKSRVERYEATG